VSSVRRSQQPEIIMAKRRNKPSGLPIINEKAAGIDIGSRFHVVAVPPDLCDEPVQTFQAFTADLQRMADWLVELGIKTVAMEHALKMLTINPVPLTEPLARSRSHSNNPTH
jgi:hypothetical protein